MPIAVRYIFAAIFVFACAAFAIAQTGDPPPVAGGAPAAAAPSHDTFFSVVFSGGVIGVSIMLAIIGLSLVAAYLVFEQALTLRKKEIVPEGLAEQVRNALLAGRVNEAEQLCHSRPSFLSFVLLSGMSELDGGWPAVEKALEDATAEQAARLTRKIEYLAAIGNLAPMMGLLGTVTGMLFTFQEVARTQGTAGAPQLADGIYHALVTTVAGLMIAIPAFGAFAIFRNKADELVADAAHNAMHVFLPYKRERKTRGAPPVGSPAPPPAPPSAPLGAGGR